MDKEMFDVLVFFGIIFGLGLLCFMICMIMTFVNKRKDKKHHKEHPEFFHLRDDFGEKADIKCNWYNNEISPRKCKVDSMLKEEHYWPQEVREQKMEEVEKLRREIYIAECMEKGLDKETEEARQKVAEYVHTHNIKWAGVWE